MIPARRRGKMLVKGEAGWGWSDTYENCVSTDGAVTRGLINVSFI